MTVRACVLLLLPVALLAQTLLPQTLVPQTLLAQDIPFGPAPNREAPAPNVSFERLRNATGTANGHYSATLGSAQPADGDSYSRA